MPSRAAVKRRAEMAIRAGYRELWKKVPSPPWPKGSVRIPYVKRKTALKKRLTEIWDPRNFEKYPGLQIALDQRRQFYTSKGRPVPRFQNPLEIQRCIYGIVDLHKGIVRAGGAGRVTNLVNPGRALIERIGDHVCQGLGLARSQENPGLLAHTTLSGAGGGQRTTSEPSVPTSNIHGLPRGQPVCDITARIRAVP